MRDNSTLCSPAPSCLAMSGGGGMPPSMPPLPPGGGLQMPPGPRGAGGPGVHPASNSHASLLQALSTSGLDQAGLKQQLQQLEQQQQRGPPPPQPFPGGFSPAGFGSFFLCFVRGAVKWISFLTCCAHPIIVHVGITISSCLAHLYDWLN